MSRHVFRPETTNRGCCFSECSCGWRGGVHDNRSVAKEAWKRHCDGVEPLAPIRSTFLLAPRNVQDGAS